MRKLKGASIQNKKTPDFKIIGKLKSDMINMNNEIEGTFVLLVTCPFLLISLTINRNPITR